ncbi:cytochrome b5 [Pisolithus microcarpus]|nr:cytochrome b5 [Pisolithus microcarpus]
MSTEATQAGSHAVRSIMLLKLLVYVLAFSLPVLFYIRQRRVQSPSSGTSAATTTETDEDKSLKTIMQPPRDDLDPPKCDPITLKELEEYDGSDPSRPIYVSIKGDVFDVTRKRDVYGKGGSYNIFAGKDGSRALGMSSLKPEDARTEMKVLDDWHSFFSKRYNIVRRVSDMPEAVAPLRSTAANTEFDSYVLHCKAP